ncbi:MAG: ABC transporter ATP-binding protein [Legionellales bacterium]|jgi:phospholipid/cholesterol/gamma-HCH transport system ATP-binding protein
MAIITVKNLMTQFGSHIVHEGLDLEINKEEILGIVGGSGSGKSVLLRTIIGLNKPKSGSINILGEELLDLSDQGLLDIQRHWGVLFQNGALFSSLTVAENIQVPMREYTHLSAKMREDLAYLKLNLVGLSANVANKMPSELSGGMRKRVALARALALDPQILFLDEPTAGLDPIAAGAFDHLIYDLQRNLDLTVVIVTHDLDTLFTICDRVAVIVDKKVIEGTLAELLKIDHPWFKAYFHGPRARHLSRDKENGN